MPEVDALLVTTLDIERAARSCQMCLMGGFYVDATHHLSGEGMCRTCWLRYARSSAESNAKVLLTLRTAHGIEELVRILGQRTYRDAPCRACESKLVPIGDDVTSCPACGEALREIER